MTRIKISKKIWPLISLFVINKEIFINHFYSSTYSFRMMSMSERLVLEVPADYDDMGDELDIDDPDGVDVVENNILGEESDNTAPEQVNNIDKSPMIIIQDQP